MNPTLPRLGWSALGALVLAAPLGATPRNAGTSESARGGISLELRDTDIRDALRLLARQGGLNLVMSDAVQGRVTLELDDVTLEQALEAVLAVGAYEYTAEPDLISVQTLEELLERGRQRAEYDSSIAAPERDALVLELRYVDAERVLTVIESMLGEGGKVTLLKTSDHVAQSRPLLPVNGAVNNLNNPQQNNAALHIGTQLASSSQGQPAKSHKLVVVDAPANLRRIERVANQLDTKPPQVLIEARFVEILLDDSRELGIDWNLVARGVGGAAPNTFPFGDSTLGSFDPNVTGGGASGVFPEAPNSVTTPGADGLFTFGTLDFTSLSAVLRLIRTDSEVQVVSNPHIVVGDRRTATILVGERFPILSTNVSDFGTVTEQLERYEPIGVQLEVTPSVLDDDEIELFVRPSISSLGQLVTGSTGLAVARINSRQIDTSVTVKDRQTVVLGGLFTTRETDTTSQVPLLGSVPILGELFRSESTRTEKVDLVVFLTVTIVDDDGLTDEQREMFRRSSRHGEGPSEGRAGVRRARLPYAFSGPAEGGEL